MSGVYIPGIKLPKNEPGDFQVIVMYVGADGKLRAECEGTHEVVPVPPHGRLIDADALLESDAEYTIPNYNSDGYVADAEGAYTCVQIENAPTVIPADKEET